MSGHTINAINTEHQLKRVGVIGTFVWDTIVPFDPNEPVVEAWGGISYALNAFDAALSDDWRFVPLIQVGSDLASEAMAYLRTFSKVARDSDLFVVPNSNNRVTLKYYSQHRRHEYLSGGVPAWKWSDLQPRLKQLDALYINLISGMELDLATMQEIRAEFEGVIYCDLHSLFLGIAEDGLRVPRAIPDIDEWLRCIDILQINGDEQELLESSGISVDERARECGVKVINVTLGENGAHHYSAPVTERLSDIYKSRLQSRNSTDQGSAGFRKALVPAVKFVSSIPPDPTGSGDVWGATYFARLLDGDKLGDAMDAAMFAAAKNVHYRGASGLTNYLRGEMTVK